MTRCVYEIIDSVDGINEMQCCHPDCGRVRRSRYDPEQVHTICRGGDPEHETGTILHDLLKERLGAGLRKKCGCLHMVMWMNCWGPEKCRENIGRVIDKMMATAEDRRWELDGRPLLSAAARVGTMMPLGKRFARRWAKRLVNEAITLSEEANRRQKDGVRLSGPGAQ